MDAVYSMCHMPMSAEQTHSSMGAMDSLTAKVNVAGNCKGKGSCIGFKQENGACASVFPKILTAAEK